MDSCFEGDVFVLRDYNQKPPFSSLLPGVAGPQGVPLWCFYVSRGQCEMCIRDRSTTSP